MATAEGIKSEDAQDLLITGVENRFGRFNKLPKPIEGLTNNESCFIAGDTKPLLLDIGQLQAGPVENLVRLALGAHT